MPLLRHPGAALPASGRRVQNDRVAVGGQQTSAFLPVRAPACGRAQRVGVVACSMQSFREALAGRPGSQGGKGTPLQQQQHLTAHATTSSLRRRGAVKTLAMFGKLFKSDPAENTRKKYQAKVEAINALEPKIQALSDDQLRAKTQEFKQRVAKGESLESLLPEAFAVGRVHAQRACMRLCTQPAAWHQHCTCNCQVLGSQVD